MKHYRVLVISLIVCLAFIRSPLPASGQDSEHDNSGLGTAEDPYIVRKAESEIRVDAERRDD